MDSTFDPEIATDNEEARAEITELSEQGFKVAMILAFKPTGQERTNERGTERDLAVLVRTYTKGELLLSLLPDLAKTLLEARYLRDTLGGKGA